jgi:hypothetical protein
MPLGPGNKQTCARKGFCAVALPCLNRDHAPPVNALFSDGQPDAKIGSLETATRA